MPTVQHKPDRVAAAMVMFVGILLAGSQASLAETGQARVPRELVNDPSYSQYAVMLIQLDLVSSPQTANLPVSVVTPEPGVILLTGTVPDQRLRQYLVENAHRISGLEVRDSMNIGDTPISLALKTDPKQLEVLTAETLSSLFPELADTVRTTVTSDGTVVLTGTVNSYESKVMLSQAVKSQPGCTAVANLLRVPANVETGEIRVTEDGQLMVKASLLPTIPPAPLFDPQLQQVKNETATAAAPPPRTIRAMTNRPLIADDAPEQSPLATQLIEDAQAALASSPKLANVNIEVSAEGSAVVLKGEVATEKIAQAAVDAVSNVPGATKIVAKLSPVSIQRNLVNPENRDSAKIIVEPPKLLGLIPLGKKSEQLPEESRMFRDSIKKSLQDLCKEELHNLNVRHSLSGLVIEGEVKNTRDRSHVFKQVDNIIELQAVPYNVVLRVKEF